MLLLMDLLIETQHFIFSILPGKEKFKRALIAIYRPRPQPPNELLRKECRQILTRARQNFQQEGWDWNLLE